MHENDKIVGTVDIDRVVCAEIPDRRTQTRLHEYVLKHMMHGPCGALNQNSVCMRDGKCSKNFPRDFDEHKHPTIFLCAKTIHFGGSFFGTRLKTFGKPE